MTINWTIYNVQKQLSDGLVIYVTYGCVATNNERYARQLGNIELTGDPESPDFIPYENLTEQDVIDWVKSGLGQDEVSRIENELLAEVDEQKAIEAGKETINGLPW